MTGPATTCSGITAACDDERRRALIDAAGPPHDGIAAVEVSYVPPPPWPPPPPAPHAVLSVYFFSGAVPPGSAGPGVSYAITGGVRVRGERLHVVAVAAMPDHLELTFDGYGDHSEYVLTIEGLGLDPYYNCKAFSFTVGCPNPFDCKQPPPPPAPLPPDPPIDYLAKDYSSFRRALLDFLPTRVPGFRETSEADLALALAELFAFVGDRLSYFQDAVANEAWLPTARQRVSVKRHARLVDYRMHDGLAARVVLQLSVTGPIVVPKGWQVVTNDADPAAVQYFETDEDAHCWNEHNPPPLPGGIAPYTWGNTQCCLPQGSTRADLTGNLTSLAAGRLLLFEEVLAPYAEPGGRILRAPADPTRRQIVRLTGVEHLTDPLTAAAVTRVTWDPRDALIFDFCLEMDEKGEPATLVSGNLVRASHGRTMPTEPIDPTRPLKYGPLTRLDPPPGAAPTWLIPPDAADPRRARGAITVVVNTETWQEQDSLLDSSPDDPHFVVDIDDAGRAQLRFGDGGLGRQLAPGAAVTATYRVGNGKIGNVGAEAITRSAAPFPAGVTALRNPLPAVGGTDPEPIVDVRRDAPQAFRAVQYRAVTLDDYVAAATGVPGVQGAAAAFRWTGSWLTIFLAVDPIGRRGLDDALRQAVADRLNSYRQAGYDYEIRPPDYVPLEIVLGVCVLPDYFQADVVAAVRDALSSGRRNDGGLGFFHPDGFTFGQSLYLSALYAVVQAVEGVRSVEAKTFKRLHEQTRGEITHGVIAVGPFQVVRLDDDPSQPDNGTLRIDPAGGK